MTTVIEKRSTDQHVRYEEVEHLVSETDPNTALCGIDQTDVPWNQGFPLCEACRAVAEGRMN